MKFRKKPVIIDAFRWTGNNRQKEDPLWVIDKIKKGLISFDNTGTKNVVMKIQTLEGVMTARIGDWIIKGVKGEIYPCKPDIFEQTYEPVEEGRE